MSKTIKTVIHSYHFDISDQKQALAYDKLCERLEGQGLKCFDSWGGKGHYHFIKEKGLNGHTVTLETTSLFNNQWNTAPIGDSANGFRVFDWAQDYMPGHMNQNIKRGHYLEQTDEMNQVRWEWLKCGYCGKMHHVEEKKVFCDKCLDSPFLSKKDLSLLRLLPVGQRDKHYHELTDSEKAEIMPRYVKAQTKQKQAENTKQRQAIVDKADKAIRLASIERDGMLWFLDNGINTNNVIFYSHVGVFSFGWRDTLSVETTDELLSLLEGFPFPYEINCEGGTIKSPNP